MTIQRDVEQLLRAHYEKRADRTVADDQLAAILDRTAGRRQRPSWLAALRSPSMTAITLARPAIPRAAWLLAAVGLISVALVAAYLVAGAPRLGPPVNGQIVFGRFDAALGDTVVYVMNPDGSKVRQLRPETHEGPFWSPDGSQIGLGHSVINADGSNYRSWDQSGNAFNVECWDWSPDGARMLCEGFADDLAADADIHGIYTVRASDGLDLVRLSRPGVGGIAGAYSPDGKLVVWGQSCVDDGNCELTIANVDGSNQRRIGTGLFGAGAAWGPDGRSLLVSVDGGLFSMDVTTGDLRRITIKGAFSPLIWGGQWSPDGKRILFRRYVSGTGENSNVDLFTMLPDGTDVVQVTNDPDDDRFFDWGTHPIQ